MNPNSSVVPPQGAVECDDQDEGNAGSNTPSVVATTTTTRKRGKYHPIELDRLAKFKNKNNNNSNTRSPPATSTAASMPEKAGLGRNRYHRKFSTTAATTTPRERNSMSSNTTAGLSRRNAKQPSKRTSTTTSTGLPLQQRQQQTRAVASSPLFLRGLTPLNHQARNTKFAMARSIASGMFDNTPGDGGEVVEILRADGSDYHESFKSGGSQQQDDDESMESGSSNKSQPNEYLIEATLVIEDDEENSRPEDMPTGNVHSTNFPLPPLLVRAEPMSEKAGSTRHHRPTNRLVLLGIIVLGAAVVATACGSGACQAKLDDGSVQHPTETISPPETTDLEAPPSGGVLTSLRYWDYLRASAPKEFTQQGTVDVIPMTSLMDTANGMPMTTVPNATTLAVCHIPVVNSRSYDSVEYTEAAAIALALHHLNAGDGSVVSALQGLPDRCPIQFTTEFTNWPSLQSSLSTNPSSNERRIRPCAFLIPTPLEPFVDMVQHVGGLGYPSLSGRDQINDSLLDNRTTAPLFARTLPSSAQSILPILLYIQNVLGYRSAVVFGRSSEFTAAIQSMAAQQDGLNVTLHTIVFDGRVAVDYSSSASDDETRRTVVQAKEAGTPCFVVADYWTLERRDRLMEEAQRQGITSDHHHWFYSGPQLYFDDEYYLPRNSSLALAYKGVSQVYFEVYDDSLPNYQNLRAQMQGLDNTADLAYMDALLASTSKEERAFSSSKWFELLFW